ncbi:MAG: hypothetical protein ACRDVE_07370 [Actinocrinis sp.]
MPACTAARADHTSATLARLAWTCAVLLFAYGLGAWITRTNLPGWAWACLWPDTAALALWLLLRATPPRRDPRLTPRRP